MIINEDVVRGTGKPQCIKLTEPEEEEQINSVANPWYVIQITKNKYFIMEKENACSDTWLVVINIVTMLILYIKKKKKESHTYII